MREFEIIRSRRKSISIEIKSDLRIVVRAPLKMRAADIDKFVKSKDGWIEKHLAIMKERTLVKNKGLIKKFTDEEKEKIKGQAKVKIPLTVEKWAKKISVKYGKISLRFQRARWGSCSAQAFLSFNCLLALCPQEVLEYVVIHELCHIKQLNHSKRFWQEVERYCPDYKTYKKWLKDNGNAIIKRL